MESKSGFSIMLEKCPACGGVVSSVAESCPHCGHPVGTIRRQVQRNQKKADMANRAAAFGKKVDHVVDEGLWLIAKLVAFAAGLLGLGFASWFLVEIVKGFLTIPGYVFVGCVFVPMIICSPTIWLANKLFGRTASLVIGRLEVILLGLAAIGVGARMEMYYHLSSFSRKAPETSLPVSYAVVTAILLIWMFVIWRKTEEIKFDVEYYKSKAAEEQKNGATTT